MKRRTRRDGGKESFWRGVVAEQAKSGQTVRAFCRQWHVSEPGFYAWRREVKLRDRETPSFAAVTLRTDESRLVADEIELRFAGGSRMRFRSGCPTELLGQVVALLERRPC